MSEHDLTATPEIPDAFIFSSTRNQLALFDVIVFAIPSFVSFHDLSHKNA